VVTLASRGPFATAEEDLGRWSGFPVVFGCVADAWLFGSAQAGRLGTFLGCLISFRSTHISAKL
jgi:hypothetical protein